jgi:hypothetical protein
MQAKGVFWEQDKRVMKIGSERLTDVGIHLPSLFPVDILAMNEKEFLMGNF